MRCYTDGEAAKAFLIEYNKEIDDPVHNSLEEWYDKSAQILAQTHQLDIAWIYTPVGHNLRFYNCPIA